MAPVPVDLFVDLADADHPSAWLRVGIGLLRPDGSILARLDRLPTNGRVRFQERQTPGTVLLMPSGPGRARRARHAPAGARGIPPLPAARRGPPRRQGEPIMKSKNPLVSSLVAVAVLAATTPAAAASRDAVGPAHRAVAENAQATAPAEQPAAAGVVNVNEATLQQLVLLPGVGPARAQAIIAHREQRPFRRVDDLLQIRGIGRVTLERLRPYVATEGRTTLTQPVSGGSRRRR